MSNEEKMTNYAYEFLDMIDTFQSHNEIWDDALEIELLKQELAIRQNPRMKFPKWGTQYFSPSSVSSDKRELFLKLKKEKKDERQNKPYQRRWTKMGTALGDMLQKELNFIEKHYEKITLDVPAFKLERTEEGYPMYEGFAKTLKTIKHKGYDVNLFGMTDGILVHQETGKRIGLEIKSKQTTSAKTSEYSMREAQPEHVLQCICYSMMYDVEDFIIVYGNLAKKSWFMDEEEIAKCPDIRAFNIKVTDEDRLELLDSLVEILEAVENDEPPKMDIEKFTFNNFKEAMAKSLTDDEFIEVKEYVKGQIANTKLPQWKKDQLFNAFQLLKELRKNG